MSDTSWPGKWVMTTRRVRGDDAGIEVYIGSLIVAKLVFTGRGKEVFVRTTPPNDKIVAESVSEGLKIIHERLRSQPQGE